MTWICTACNEARHDEYNKVDFGWSEVFPDKYYSAVCADCIVMWLQQLINGTYKPKDEMIEREKESK